MGQEAEGETLPRDCLSGQLSTGAHPTLTLMAQCLLFLGTFLTDLEVRDPAMEDYLEVADLRHGLG